MAHERAPAPVGHETPTAAAEGLQQLPSATGRDLTVAPLWAAALPSAGKALDTSTVAELAPGIMADQSSQESGALDAEPSPARIDRVLAPQGDGPTPEVSAEQRRQLEGVRVHTDDAAASSARRLGADAYAVGQNIVFRDGKFDPKGARGRRLLAHELLHTVDASAAGGPHVVRRQSAGDAESIRAAQLRTDYAAAVTAGDWVKAATLANGFNDAELQAKLMMLTAAQKARMMAAARQDPAIGNGMRIVSRLEGLLTRPAGNVFGQVTHAAVPHPPATGGADYSFEFRISFHPDTTVAHATKIGFIQTSRVVAPGTNTNMETLEPQNSRRNADQAAVDRIPQRKFGFYGVNNDGTSAGTITFGVASTTPPTDAAFFDRPRDNMVNVSFNFETAVVAMEGPQAGVVYSVVHWGFDISATGVMTGHTVSHDDTVSASFGKAMDAWNAQAAGPAGGRNDPNQQPLAPVQ